LRVWSLMRMSILDRLLGLIAAPAYALRRSRVAFLRLHVGATLCCLASATYVAYHAWPQGLTLGDVLAIGLCLVLLVLLLWAHARRYMVFRSRPLALAERMPDLAPEEKLFLRGSGFFEVSEMRRYLVEVPVVFWTTQLGEHIVAAKVRAFNILGLGVPSMERGWWYVFIDSRRVIDITPGELCFGYRVCPAVRVTYATDKGHDTLHLSCADRGQLDVLCKELRDKMEAARGGSGASGVTGDG